MIKLIDAVLLESQVRQCPALETFLQKIRLSMWPVFQKQMHSQLESVRKLTGGNILKSTVKDSTLKTVSSLNTCKTAGIEKATSGVKTLLGSFQLCRVALFRG
jgi:hypothetical protein